MPLVSTRAEWGAPLCAMAQAFPLVIKPTIGGGAWAPPASARQLMRELGRLLRQPPWARPTPSLEVLAVLDHTWTMTTLIALFRLTMTLMLSLCLRSIDSSCVYESCA